MKKLLVIAFICIYPLTAPAHPGKTDRYGGHKCLKGCGEWGLFYEEYHLHDKDWKPIRITRKKVRPRDSRSAERSNQSPSLPAGPIPQPVVQSITTTQYVTVVKEENALSFNPLLFVLLIFLMLLLILRLNRKKKSTQ